MNTQKSQYGLVGYPLGHSLSPLMHNAAFQKLEVPAVYELFPLEEDQLEVFFKSLKEDDSTIFGLNVTVPYKEKVIQYIDKMTPFAERAKAVNTIVIDENRNLIGYNTDGPGFLSHLADLKVETADKKAAIIGAGGASRAVVTALCLIVKRPLSIKIYDIDKAKAEHLIADLGERFDVSIVESVASIDDLCIEESDILINATPIGMKADDPCLIDDSLIHPGLFVYDIIYNPAETKLLKLAKQNGAKISNGLGMLYYQGVLAFQHWADMEVSPDVKNIMRQALEEGLNQ